MNILFWDIDGTLIRTSKAGLYAISQAVESIWGQEADFDKIQTAGMTDNYICQQVIRAIAGREPSAEEIAVLCRHYETLLPEQLASRVGIVLPSVREILDRLHGRDDCRLLLLTGNSRKGAQIKLDYFGLNTYFDFSRSAFAEQHYRRVDIARFAANIVQDSWGDPRQHKLFVLGDTPHDIECGKAIGAHTIGIATGNYSFQQLEQCCPWWTVEALPAVEEFIDKVTS